MPRPGIENCCIHVTHRCHGRRFLLYVDMNMVRVGVVRHPRDWRFGGCNELSGSRKRYRVIDRSTLLRCLAFPDDAAFYEWHDRAITALCREAVLPTEPYWSTAFAVGERAWIGQLTQNDPAVEQLVRPAEEASMPEEDSGTWFLKASRSLAARLRRRLIR